MTSAVRRTLNIRSAVSRSMASHETDSFARLFIIRHGGTAWTDSHQHTGLTDIPLNADCEQQARRLGVRLRGERFARVFTSPLIRARRTCELAGFGDGADVSPALVEWDYGDYEGRVTDDIIASGPIGTSFATVLPTVNRPNRSLPAPIASSRGCARSTAMWLRFQADTSAA